MKTVAQNTVAEASHPTTFPGLVEYLSAHVDGTDTYMRRIREEAYHLFGDKPEFSLKPYIKPSDVDVPHGILEKLFWLVDQLKETNVALADIAYRMRTMSGYDERMTDQQAVPAKGTKAYKACD